MKILRWNCAVNQKCYRWVRSFFNILFTDQSLQSQHPVPIFLLLPWFKNVLNAFPDNFTNIRGVWYELWNTHKTSNKSSILKSNDVFSGPPDISSVTSSFSITAFSGLSYYSLREHGYVVVRVWKLYGHVHHEIDMILVSAVSIPFPFKAIHNKRYF